MSGDSFTLDTNTLIHSVDRTADPHREVAKEIMERATFASRCADQTPRGSRCNNAISDAAASTPPDNSKPPATP